METPFLVGQHIVVFKESGLDLLVGPIGELEVKIDVALWGSVMLEALVIVSSMATVIGGIHLALS